VANIPKVWNGTAFIELEAAATVAPAASTTVVGIVQLTDSTSSTSTTTAATPNSVKSAYDLAGTAIPKNTVTTAGDILYASGSATVARLGIGTASQVLGIAAGVPAWTTPAAGGGMTIIGTATPSAATTISFTSIPDTYKHLFLVWRLYQSVNTAVFAIRLNNDSGNNYHGNFVFQRSTENRLFDGTSNDRIGSSFYVDGNPVNKTDTGATDYQYHSQGQLDIYNYTNTTECAYTASSRSYSSHAGSSGYRNIDIRGIYRTGGTAVNRIDFVRNSTQTVSGTVYLYGVS
jgi:hypothetical protein